MHTVVFCVRAESPETVPLQIRAAISLDLPCLVTEQYPKALGTTIQPIKDVLSEKMETHAKLTFSMDGKSMAILNTANPVGKAARNYVCTR